MGKLKLDLVCFFNVYFFLFIWVNQVLAEAHGIICLHCGMQDL